MIKINNNIILEIEGKFFNTFETDMSEISNKNKKKYKNVTKTILKLQDIYGIENEVNYILKEKNDDSESKGGELIGGEFKVGENNGGIKTIVFDKNFLGGSGWDGAQDGGIEQEEEEEEIKEQEGGKWGSHSEPFTVQAGGQWTGSMPPVEDSSR